MGQLAPHQEGLADKSRRALAGAGFVPLAADEERALAARIQGGDLEAAWTLALANHNFVRSVASRYVRDEIALEDLVAEGLLGLVEAARRFDPERNIKFITYGVWWVKRAILKHLRTFEHPVHVPKYKHHQLHDMRRALRSLGQDLGRVPTTDELCAVLGTTPLEAAELLALAGASESLDALPEGGDVPDQAIADLEEAILRDDAVQRLREAIPGLPERERRIVEERYGLDGGEGATLSHLGEKIGLTKERVRQIEKDACRRLRSALETVAPRPQPEEPLPLQAA